MEIARLDPWTMRLSTRAQIEAIERWHRSDVSRFHATWLPNGSSFEDRSLAREWLSSLASSDGTSIQFHFDDRDELFEITVTESPSIRALDALAIAISRDLKWTLPSTRAWLVTRGARPVVHAVRMTVPDAPPMPQHPDDDEDATEAFADYFLTPPTVVLEVRLDTPTKVIADYYKEAQAIYEQDTGLALERGREMAEWTLELVAFVVNRNDGRGWPAVLEEWNSQHQHDWSFETSKKINLAARAGYKNLMGRDLIWQGPSVRSTSKTKEIQ